jgi:DNA repair protein RecO (recombination protein O)
MSRDEAVVLHARPYGDHDAVVSLFSRDHGRVSVFARGARAQKKKGSMLVPPHVVTLELSRRPSTELFSARAVEIETPHARLSTDLLRVSAANVLLEDCRELFADGEGDRVVYEALKASLDALESASVLDVITAFEGALSRALGMGDVSGEPRIVFAQRTRIFSSLRGRDLPARAFFVSMSKGQKA